MKKHFIWAIRIQIIFISLLWGLLGYASTEKELFKKGVVLLDMEKYQQAADVFSRVIELRPDAADAYRNRGVAYMKQKKWDLAVADFLKTLEIQPELEGMHANMGVARYYQQDHARAIENYNKEISKFPDSYFSYFNRAICWAELKAYEKSLADVNKTLELAPGLYAAVCMKGDLYVKMGQLNEAGKAYEQAIEISPDQPYAKTRLSLLRQETSRSKGAVSKEIVSKQIVYKQIIHDDVVVKPINIARPSDADFNALQDDVVLKPIPPKPLEQRSPNLIATSSGKEPDFLAKRGQDKNRGHTPSASTVTDMVYELQTGSFRVEENAQAASLKLKQMGFVSRIVESIASDGTHWYQVRAGNYDSYSLAKEASGYLKEQIGVKAVVKSATSR